MEDLGFWPVVVGGVLGALVGGYLEWRRRVRRARAAEPEPTSLDPAERARRREEVTPMLQRAGRAVAAYSHIIDAGNAGEIDMVQRLFERLKGEEAEDGASDVRPGDRRFVEVSTAFQKLHDEIEAKITQRLAAGQAAALAGEIRLRGPALARAVEDLNAAANRYSGR